MKLRLSVFLFIALFWPIGLILHNQSSELLTFVAPTLLLSVTYKFYKNNCWYFVIPLLLISTVSPKLTLFPILFLALQLIATISYPNIPPVSFPRKWESIFTWIPDHVVNDNMEHKRKRTTYKLIVISLLISFALMVFNWTEFKGQSIFKKDYEAEQLVIRNQQLYPTSFSARVFHNKWKIVTDKATYNFFALTDLNNYFFGFAPRQIVGNQNVQKFPFMALPFFLYGLYLLVSPSRSDPSVSETFIKLSLIALLINLSLLSTFDRNDFILYVPIALITTQGLFQFIKSFKYSKIYSYIFIIYSSIEIVRIFLTA